MNVLHAREIKDLIAHQDAIPESLRSPTMDALLATLSAYQTVVVAAQEVEASVPSTYSEDDPTVQRHARALNELGQRLSALLEEPS